jgi:hypothetical protein
MACVPCFEFAPQENCMSAPHDTPLLTTPLNALHLELGARMVPFAGYSMPVQYPAGLMAEHHHTRDRRRPVRRLAHGPAAPGGC